MVSEEDDVADLTVLIGSVEGAIAYQNAAPAVIDRFDFAQIGFAMLRGLVFFADTPDIIFLIGVILIVVAGIISV